MVIAILEPVFAGIVVSLLNKYVINGWAGTWLQSWCVSPENVIEQDDDNADDEVDQNSSTNTTISDADVHIHCH